MKQSGIGVDKQVSDLRLSQSHWIEDRTNKLVDKLSERMNWITGLRTSAMFDKGAKKEEYEYLQIGSYGTGGYYDVHQVSNGTAVKIFSAIIFGSIVYVFKKYF